MSQPTLFDLTPGAPEASASRVSSAGPMAPVAPPPDQPAREFAVDPRHHVVLEASAGTGKTRVLVDRYVRLLVDADVDPRHILAITFTRKAAAEMRERVLDTLRRRAALGQIDATRWAGLQARSSEIQISTIDAFCFGLLREFPLEADVNPDFAIADETETARFANEALDTTMRDARALLPRDEHVRLLFARVKPHALRQALARLLDRRQVALPAVARFVSERVRVANAAAAAEAFLDRLRSIVAGSPHQRALLEEGPSGVPEFEWLRRDLGRVLATPTAPSADAPPLEGDAGRALSAWIRQLRRGLEAYFLTRDGKPRQRLLNAKAPFPSAGAKKRHAEAVAALAPEVTGAIVALDRDVNGLLARGLLRVLVLAARRYESLLDEHALLDFTGMLDCAITLLGRQEEFARSRLKLQSRYHHLLIDEFQDTSRRQWTLIDLLIEAWAEGEGTAEGTTSIFIVGDRKQSIYRFRHAEVTLLDEAARRIAALRPDRPARHAITTSFRAVPELLAFVNAFAAGMQGDPALPDRWRYESQDVFPVVSVPPGARRDGHPVVGLVAESSIAASARAVAAEIDRLLRHATVRDRSGPPRSVRPEDIAILFRARAGHQFFEEALEARGIRSYVYKGLGFFDAPEVQDLQALVRYLAQPDSHLRAAELLRSRLVRLSDNALVQLGPRIADALLAAAAPGASGSLAPLDAALLQRARDGVRRWLSLADRIPPSELVDHVIAETAFLYEIRGPRLDQARENVKKLRALIRRVENRGYATLARLAAYFETLRAGDDSNAIVEAAGAVNLMTMHAAKGLEFPIVFLVNLQAPGHGGADGIAVVEAGADGEPEVTFGSSESTRLEAQRELEELRRLLYVAITRARDRLYLSAEVKDGTLRRSPRSLGSLLPSSLADLFAAASTAADGDEVPWVSGEGSFALRVCRAPENSEQPRSEPAVALTDSPVAASPALVPSGLTVVAANEVFADEAEPLPGVPHVRRSDRLTGVLVHRLLQRGVRVEESDADLRRAIRRVIDSDDRVDIGDDARVMADVLGFYRGLTRQPEITSLLTSGTCLWEMPFSYISSDTPTQCVRGVIDCLVVDAGGEGATVLEFKTGSPRPEHQAQADLYARAVRAAWGFSRVTARVCYPAPAKNPFSEG